MFLYIRALFVYACVRGLNVRVHACVDECTCACVSGWNIGVHVPAAEYTCLLERFVHAHVCVDCKYVYARFEHADVCVGGIFVYTRALCAHSMFV